MIFTLITTITQQSSIKTEQFIDVQRLFPFCRCRSFFVLKDRKDKQESFLSSSVGADTGQICTEEKHFLALAIPAFSQIHEAFFLEPKLCGTAHFQPIVDAKSPRRGGITLMVCVGAFIIYSFSFHHFMFQDMSLPYFSALVHKKIEFVLSSLDQRVKREKIARLRRFSCFFAGRRDEREQKKESYSAGKRGNFSLNFASLCTVCSYLPSSCS